MHCASAPTQLGGAINFVMPTGYDADLFGARIDVGSFGFHKAAVNSGGVYGPGRLLRQRHTAWRRTASATTSDGESVKAPMNLGYRLTPNVETRFYLNANRVRQRIPGAVTKRRRSQTPKAPLCGPACGDPNINGLGNDNVDRDYQRNLDTFRVANKTSVRMAPGTVVEFGAFYMDRHLDHPILFVLDNQHNEYGGFGRIVDESMIGGFKNRFIAGVDTAQWRCPLTPLPEQPRHQGRLDLRRRSRTRPTPSFTPRTRSSCCRRSRWSRAHNTWTPRASRRTCSSPMATAQAEGSYDFWNPEVGFVWDVTRNAQIFGNISERRSANVQRNLDQPRYHDQPRGSARHDL